MPLRELAHKTSFVSFLEEALQYHYQSKGKVNLSDFSRRAGFSSRSYMCELLAGRKGLSRDSLLRIKSTLKLPKKHLQLLELLAYNEDPRLSSGVTSRHALKQKLEIARTAVLNDETSDKAHTRYAKFAGQTQLHRVYAALGTPREGATLSDINARTRLALPAIEQALSALKAEGLCIQNCDRYYASQNKVEILSTQQQEELFGLTQDVCTQIKKQARQIATSDSQLLLYSAFPVCRSELPKIKRRIREAITAIIDEVQDDSGDQVEQIFISMLSPE